MVYWSSVQVLLTEIWKIQFLQLAGLIDLENNSAGNCKPEVPHWVANKAYSKGNEEKIRSVEQQLVDSTPRPQCILC